MAERGRPKKIKTDVVENKEVDVKLLEKENKQLKNELDEIKKMLLNMQKTQPIVEVVNPAIESVPEDNDDVDIRPNKYIKVMSLNFGKLVLSTEGKGQGKVFVFEKFGDVKNIVYADLANLIHHQQTFAEQGRFYIFDKKVVKNHGLVEYYDKFMNKETIENILDCNRNQLEELFKNTTDTQRETIINILISKIRNAEDVDLNKVDIISRIYGENIYDKANDLISNDE